VSDPLDLTRRRIALGLVLPVALLIAVLLPYWLFHARLPEPLATNWNWHGQPVNSTPLILMALMFAGFSVVPMFVMFKAAFLPAAARGEISGRMGVAIFATGSIAAFSWIITLANLDVDTWKQAGPLRLGPILLSIAVVAALGAVVAAASRVLETARGDTTHNLPSAGLAPRARAVWMGTARMPGAMPSAIVFLLMALIGWERVLSLVYLFLGVNALLFAAIRVTVDRNGVRIAHGLLGWPVKRVRLAQIRQASMVQVKRIPWGGAVYQGSLNLLGRAAIVMHEGPGLRLELDGDRTLDIAVDEAEQAAGVINDLIAAERGVA
jgi:hypothetical protein